MTEPDMGDSPGSPDLPDTASDDSPDKAAAIVGYLACAIIPIGFFLGPLATLLIWRLRRQDPLADFHGRQALDVTFAGLLAAIATWLLLRGAHAILVPRGFGGFMANLLVLQYIVPLIYVGLLIWGAVAAGRGQYKVLPLGLPWLRRGAKGMPKNDEPVEESHGA